MFEDGTLEFKSEYSNNIKKTVVAFANTSGGRILIGVNDDGTTRGVENVDDVMLRVSNMLRDTIKPDLTLFLDYAPKERDGKTIVEIDVTRGTARPYYLADKGIRPEGVFVRQGASSVPASESAILKMIKETSGDRYEDERSRDQELTFNYAGEYFKKRGLDLAPPKQRTLHFIGGDEDYTNLALLLSDQCLPTIKLAVFAGSQKTIFKTRRETTGSLLKQLEEAFAFIDINNNIVSDFNGLYRIDRRDYPAEAIREALLNTIVHRDYALTAPTLISIFDDRIEFVNVGGLVREVTLDDVMLGVSALRNPNLANIFYRLDLIEAFGTGLYKIRESYAEHDVKPVFENTNNAFKVTLPNINYNAASLPGEHFTPITGIPVGQRKTPQTPEQERVKTILGLFKTQKTISRKEVEDALKLSASAAVGIIRRLTAQGLLVKENAGKNTRYRLAKK